MWGRRNWKVQCDQMRWARLRRIRLHWITTTTRDWSFPRNEQKKSDYKNSDHTKNCLKSLNFFIFCLNYVSMDHFSVRGDEDHTGYNFWGFLLRHFVITYCLFIYNLAVYLKNKTISFVTKHNQIFIYEQRHICTKAFVSKAQKYPKHFTLTSFPKFFPPQLT